MAAAGGRVVSVVGGVLPAWVGALGACGVERRDDVDRTLTAGAAADREDIVKGEAVVERVNKPSRRVSDSQEHDSMCCGRYTLGKIDNNVFDYRYIVPVLSQYCTRLLPVQQGIDKIVLFSVFATQAPLPTSCRSLGELFYSGDAALLFSSAVSS